MDLFMVNKDKSTEVVNVWRTPVAPGVTPDTAIGTPLLPC